MNWPHEVVSYMTADNKLHKDRDTAERWQANLDGAARATLLLQQGSNLHAALVEGGFILPGSYPELVDVTTETKLIISHWQCRDEPGYSPCRIDHSGEVFVHGHAGSWSGPYGAMCSISDVAYYWKATKAKVSP